MGLDWIIIETIPILVESFAYLFFLSKRFQAKYDCVWPDATAYFAIVIWGIMGTFLKWPPSVYDITVFVLLFVYLLVLKDGLFLQKAMGVFLLAAISMAVSLVGAGIAALMTNATYQQTLETRDMTRLLSLIFTKMTQVTVFYVLAKKQQPIQSLKRKPILALCSMAILDFMCLMFIWYYVQTPGMDNQQHHTHRALIWIAALLLLQLIALFVTYELFIREEEENINLSASLQRAELEQIFYQEIDVMYADMRNWRHDYNTNLVALRAMIEENETDKALDFIDQISHEPEKVKRTLQTGNLILDAVVSSKLWLAQTKDIETNIQAVSLGKEMNMEDHDFCSVVGNLLDNAIDACERIRKDEGKRFIDISLLVKGRNMVLTISNSFNGELKCSGNRYLSLKKEGCHGIGLKHVDSIVEKYNGQIMREIKGCLFETCVVLPII